MGKEHAIVVRYRKTWSSQYNLVVPSEYELSLLLQVGCSVEVGKSKPRGILGHVGRGTKTPVDFWA